MKFKSLILSIVTVAGLYSISASAQTELIADQTGIKKAGCSDWTFRESGPAGPSGSGKRYAIFSFTCNNTHVGLKTIIETFGVQQSCSVALTDTGAAAGYTLSGNTCASFSYYGSTASPTGPTYAYTGRVGGCGGLPNGAVCPAPEYWVNWASVVGSTSYQYEIYGLPYGTTSTTSVTIPFGYLSSLPTGRVRACSNNGCGNWTTITPAPY